MKLSNLKQVLNQISDLQFKLPNGSFVPAHFHVTEVGYITRKFIDCGGVLRTTEVVNFQLWSADDLHHRLAPSKLAEVIAIAEKEVGLQDAAIEVEYQGGATIEKYGLEFKAPHFELVSLKTDCLAPDKCQVPDAQPKVNLATLSTSDKCEPGSGCC